MWDTPGFCLPRGGAINPRLPYEQAHVLLRDLPNGVNLILLCASKDEIRSNNPWLRNLYWLINDFFFDGCAPVALVVTHFDALDNLKKWWEDNQRTICSKTTIPVTSIPRVCTTTARSGSDESGLALRSLLEKCATSALPIPLHDHLPSHGAACLVDKCGLTSSDAAELVDKFSRPQNQLNVPVVLSGKAGSGESSVLNTERPIATVSSSIQRGLGWKERGGSGRGPSVEH